MKKIVSFLASIFLISLCLVQPVFAKDSNKKEKLDIDKIYAETYAKAVSSSPSVIDSDESAYAYLISNMEYLQRRNDGTIMIGIQDMTLSEHERKRVLSFLEKLNTLIQLDAISVDDKLQLHFVFNPIANKETYRMPTANILGEARNHAKELKSVFDNAVFTQKHYVAGMYFAERVKSGGIWDYKSYMGTNTLYYMEDLKTNMTGETIGNFHYGYVGRAVFGASTLKSAAGMYQIISGTSDWGYWDSFFDDPSDQQDIEWGIRVYESEH